MGQTFFFYDLETSGLNPRTDRIMQFAGIRTDEQFRPLGQAYNALIRLNDDTLPSPGALMVTGITPQQTVTDGYTEAEFAKLFIEEICTSHTVVLGFNNIRFDDEFIRALLWRNYYDPYEWSYKDGRSRWDMLDVVRLTRALRPDGITWPVVDGVATNKLELLSQVNGLEHTKAHDALSDVEALVGMTKLIATKQPQLFDYLFSMRHKEAVRELAKPHVPFVYASGRYDNEWHKTTVAMAISEADFGNVYVYDLRHDPTPWLDKSVRELVEIMTTPWSERGDDYQPLPAKKMQPNRTPAVAPLGVLNHGDGWNRIGLTLQDIERHRKVLLARPDFIKRLTEALSTRPQFAAPPDAEAKLYDGFISEHDRQQAEHVRRASATDIATLAPRFKDARLAEMFPRYKARNFEQVLSADERTNYEAYRRQRLEQQAPGFVRELQRLARKQLTSHQAYVLEELKLWFEAIMPVADE